YTTNFYTTHAVNSKVENVFKITNNKATATCFETETFSLMANKTYKFSVKVKVEDLASGSAYLKLVEVDEENDSPKSSDSLTISTTSNKFEANFVEYSIYVQSDPTKSREVKLQIGLGETSSTAKGTAYFKDYKITSVPYSEFNSASSSTAKTLNFASDYSTSTDVSNFAFNLNQSLDISEINEVKINKPADWTINNSNSGYSQTAGVFNVKDFVHLNKDGLTNIANPGFISKYNTTTNNVLMLHNEMSDVISATSSSFSLTKNSYYEISVWVQTQVSGEQQSGASIVLNKSADETSNLVLSRLDNIKTNGHWQEISFYIQTGYEDLDVTLTLSLGNKNQTSNGYAFFDNIFAETSSEEVYTANLDQNPENVFDLKNPLSANGNLYFEGTSQNKLNTTRASIINLDSDLSEFLVSADYESARGTTAENRSILAILSTIQDDYYSFSSLLNYSLTSGSYYKLSVDVYTAYLKTNNEDAEAGASIGLTNIEDSKFKAIKSDKTWTTYTFYIS
ncbi:MAG: hypothetical protein IJZ77_04235, partial [Bacilli bacterium]|nr:hypothetical protein [Bacilli bacterium]